MSKYRKSWETREFLKDWIQEVPNDNTKAYCRACKIKLYAHRYSVLKHTATKKHQDNYKKLLQNSEKDVLSSEHSLVPTQRKLTARELHEKIVIDVCAEEEQECLLEEAIIEGDALVYNESIDVFLSRANDGDQPFLLKESPMSLDSVNQYETSSDTLPAEINSCKKAEVLKFTNETVS